MKFTLITLAAGILCVNAQAQSMHFSQYYAAPMLLNPANTALTSENDYRVGINARNQWATVPVPYNTISAFADCKLFHNEENNNWLGIGAAFFNDVAGDGNLSLARYEGFAAYHLGIGDKNMISVGGSFGYVQRSVNFGALTFDQQWDGLSFNPSLSNGEKNYVAKTTYTTIGAGINYAYFPNENTYIKAGFGLANINQPKESFYNSSTNQINMRPTVNVDGIFQINEFWALNPSVYYTTQGGAYELVYGSLVNIRLNAGAEKHTEVILGAFNRINDAVIGAAGLRWNGFQAIASYDLTISKLAPYTSGYGAMEFSLIYQGNYGNLSFTHEPRRTMNCPRF